MEKLEPYLARYLPQTYLSVLVPLMVSGFVFAMDPLSALLLLGTAPVIPVMMILVGSYAEEHAGRQWAALSRMGAHFLDALRGLPTLKAFGRSGDERERVARVGEEFRVRTMKVLRYAFLSGLVLEFMTSAAIALVAVSLGVRLINGAIPFDEAFLVLLLAPEFYKPLRELGATRHAALEGRAAASRILEVLETPAAPRREARTTPPPPTGAPTVELVGVRFAYPGSGREALRGVDLTLSSGTTTALVGRSGSGKSTLVDLLLGFSVPREGGIYADGAPISSLPVEVWREGWRWCRSGPTCSTGRCSRTSGWRAPGRAGPRSSGRRSSRGRTSSSGGSRGATTRRSASAGPASRAARRRGSPSPAPSSRTPRSS
nr:ABC transporter transmembrane domain-containing protein [Rubrobacter marinus]